MPNQTSERYTRRQLFEFAARKALEKGLKGLAATAALQMLTSTDRVQAQGPIAQKSEPQHVDILSAIENSQKLDPQKKAQFKNDLSRLRRRLEGNSEWYAGSRWEQPANVQSQGTVYVNYDKQSKTEAKVAEGGYEAEVTPISNSQAVVQSMTRDAQGNVYMAGSVPTLLEENTTTARPLKLPPGYTRATSFETNPNGNGESTIVAVRYENGQPRLATMVGSFDAHKGRFVPNQDYSIDTGGRNYTTVTYIDDYTLLLTSWYPTYNEQLGILEYHAAFYNTRTKQWRYVGSLDEPIEGAATRDGETINIVSSKGLYTIDRQNPRFADKPDVVGNFSSILFMTDKQSGQKIRVLGGLQGIWYGDHFIELPGGERVNMIHALTDLDGKVLITHREEVSIYDPQEDTNNVYPICGNDKNLREATYAVIRIDDKSALVAGTWGVVKLTNIHKNSPAQNRSIRN